MSLAAPSRPLLRYFGGKWQLGPWIVQHLPGHRYYAEPFAGAASVLLRKPVAPGGELLNDLNEDVVNLFRVLQDWPSYLRLRHGLRHTPYAEAELVISLARAVDPVERARRLVVRSYFGIETAGLDMTASGWRMGTVPLHRLDQDGKPTYRNCARDWANWQGALDAIRERLCRVMIHNRDALEFIDLVDAEDALLYVDPPYHPATRERVRYAVEFDEAAHVALVDRLLACRARVCLSGYRHPDYEPLQAAGWRRVDRDYRANMSPRRRVESLWMNY